MKSIAARCLVVRHALSIICLLLACLNVQAKTAATYGPEFEFRGIEQRMFWAAVATTAVTSGLDTGSALDALATLSFGSGLTFMAANMLPSVRVAVWAAIAKSISFTGRYRVELANPKILGPSFRVVYPDGFWFQVDTDMGTIEITMKPLTLAELRVQQERIERDIFVAAKRQGLVPPVLDLFGGGHINIGFQSTFGSDALLFRNFLVDLANHYELMEGIFLDNNLDARSILQHGEKPFREAISAFDSGEVSTIEDLAARVHQAVKSVSGSLGGWAIRLFTIVDPKMPLERKRLEIRSVRSQRSAQEFSLIVGLFNDRIEMLRLRQVNNPNYSIPVAKWHQISDHEKIAAFRSYVEESGRLSWDSYRPLLRGMYAAAERRMRAEDPVIENSCLILFENRR